VRQWSVDGRSGISVRRGTIFYFKSLGTTSEHCLEKTSILGVGAPLPCRNEPDFLCFPSFLRFSPFICRDASVARKFEARTCDPEFASLRGCFTLQVALTVVSLPTVSLRLQNVAFADGCGVPCLTNGQGVQHNLSFLKQNDCDRFLIDMDGVIIAGASSDSARMSFNSCVCCGNEIPFLFLTNNSQRTRPVTFQTKCTDGHHWWRKSHIFHLWRCQRHGSFAKLNRREPHSSFGEGASCCRRCTRMVFRSSIIA